MEVISNDVKKIFWIVVGHEKISEGQDLGYNPADINENNVMIVKYIGSKIYTYLTITCKIHDKIMQLTQ